MNATIIATIQGMTTGCVLSPLVGSETAMIKITIMSMALGFYP